MGNQRDIDVCRREGRENLDTARKTGKVSPEKQNHWERLDGRCREHSRRRFQGYEHRLAATLIYRSQDEPPRLKIELKKTLGLGRRHERKEIRRKNTNDDPVNLKALQVPGAWVFEN